MLRYYLLLVNIDFPVLGFLKFIFEMAILLYSNNVTFIMVSRKNVVIVIHSVLPGSDLPDTEKLAILLK